MHSTNPNFSAARSLCLALAGVILCLCVAWGERTAHGEEDGDSVPFRLLAASVLKDGRVLELREYFSPVVEGRRVPPTVVDGNDVPTRVYLLMTRDSLGDDTVGVLWSAYSNRPLFRQVRAIGPITAGAIAQHPSSDAVHVVLSASLSGSVLLEEYEVPLDGGGGAAEHVRGLAESSDWSGGTRDTSNFARFRLRIRLVACIELGTPAA